MKVFISYRRSDTQDLAGRIADRLRQSPDVDRVFIDVDDIAPGADFSRRIRDEIDQSDVCLVLIGEAWTGPSIYGGAARIFDEEDFVRREAEAALASGIKVLPVLANAAAMPKEMDLPPALHGLPQINALSVRHAYFEHDVAYLLDTLRGNRRPGRARSYLHAHPVVAAFLRLIAGGLATLVVLVVFAAIHKAVTGRALSEALGGIGNLLLFVLVVLALGASAAVYLGGRRKAR